MTHKIPRLAFDTDGVLANFMQAFLGLVNTNFHTDFHTSQISEYHPIGDGKLLSQQQWDTGFNIMKQTPYFWANLKPFDQTFFPDLNLDMLNFAFNGYFVTRRADLEVGNIQDANALTRIWLENVGLSEFTAVVAQQSSKRIEILRAIEADAYLDDWGEQFEECRDAGINAYLIDRPWNQHIVTPYRVYNVKQFVGRVLKRIPDLNSVFAHDTDLLPVEHRVDRVAASQGRA